MVTAVELVIRSLAGVVAVPVVSKVPAKRPPVFVRVEQAAPASFSPSHDRVMVIVQVYGEHARLEEVLHTIGVCRDFLRFEISQVVPLVVGYSEVSGPVEFLDPDIADTYTRWQLVGNVIHALR